jgi:hypothetical protein
MKDNKEAAPKVIKNDFWSRLFFFYKGIVCPKIELT